MLAHSSSSSTNNYLGRPSLKQQAFSTIGGKQLIYLKLTYGFHRVVTLARQVVVVIVIVVVNYNSPKKGRDKAHFSAATS